MSVETHGMRTANWSNIEYTGDLIIERNGLYDIQNPIAKKYGYIVLVRCDVKLDAQKPAGTYWVKIGKLNSSLPPPISWFRQLLIGNNGALGVVSVGTNPEIYLTNVLTSITAHESLNIELMYGTNG